jgi:hypothetical protein
MRLFTAIGIFCISSFNPPISVSKAESVPETIIPRRCSPGLGSTTMEVAVVLPQTSTAKLVFRAKVKTPPMIGDRTENLLVPARGGRMIVTAADGMPGDPINNICASTVANGEAECFDEQWQFKDDDWSVVFEYKDDLYAHSPGDCYTTLNFTLKRP